MYATEDEELNAAADRIAALEKKLQQQNGTLKNLHRDSSAQLEALREKWKAEELKRLEEHNKLAFMIASANIKLQSESEAHVRQQHSHTHQVAQLRQELASAVEAKAAAQKALEEMNQRTLLADERQSADAALTKQLIDRLQSEVSSLKLCEAELQAELSAKELQYGELKKQRESELLTRLSHNELQGQLQHQLTESALSWQKKTEELKEELLSAKARVVSLQQELETFKAVHYQSSSENGKNVDLLQAELVCAQQQRRSHEEALAALRVQIAVETQSRERKRVRLEEENQRQSSLLCQAQQQNAVHEKQRLELEVRIKDLVQQLSQASANGEAETLALSSKLAAVRTQMLAEEALKKMHEGRHASLKAEAEQTQGQLEQAQAENKQLSAKVLYFMRLLALFILFFFLACFIHSVLSFLLSCFSSSYINLLSNFFLVKFGLSRSPAHLLARIRCGEKQCRALYRSLTFLNLFAPFSVLLKQLLGAQLQTQAVESQLSVLQAELSKLRMLKFQSIVERARMMREHQRASSASSLLVGISSTDSNTRPPTKMTSSGSSPAMKHKHSESTPLRWSTTTGGAALLSDAPAFGSLSSKTEEERTEKEAEETKREEVIVTASRQSRSSSPLMPSAGAGLLHASDHSQLTAGEQRPLRSDSPSQRLVKPQDTYTKPQDTYTKPQDTYTKPVSSDGSPSIGHNVNAHVEVTKVGGGAQIVAWPEVGAGSFAPIEHKPAEASIPVSRRSASPSPTPAHEHEHTRRVSATPVMSSPRPRSPSPAASSSATTHARRSSAIPVLSPRPQSPLPSTATTTTQSDLEAVTAANSARNRRSSGIPVLSPRRPQSSVSAAESVDVTTAAPLPAGGAARHSSGYSAASAASLDSGAIVSSPSRRKLSFIPTLLSRDVGLVEEMMSQQQPVAIGKPLADADDSSSLHHVASTSSVRAIENCQTSASPLLDGQDVAERSNVTNVAAASYSPSASVCVAPSTSAALFNSSNRIPSSLSAHQQHMTAAAPADSASLHVSSESLFSLNSKSSDGEKDSWLANAEAARSLSSPVVYAKDPFADDGQSVASLPRLCHLPNPFLLPVTGAPPATDANQLLEAWLDENHVQQLGQLCQLVLHSHEEEQALAQALRLPKRSKDDDVYGEWPLASPFTIGTGSHSVPRHRRNNSVFATSAEKNATVVRLRQLHLATSGEAIATPSPRSRIPLLRKKIGECDDSQSTQEATKATVPEREKDDSSGLFSLALPSARNVLMRGTQSPDRSPKGTSATESPVVLQAEPIPTDELRGMLRRGAEAGRASAVESSWVLEDSKPTLKSAAAAIATRRRFSYPEIDFTLPANEPAAAANTAIAVQQKDLPAAASLTASLIPSPRKVSFIRSPLSRKLSIVKPGHDAESMECQKSGDGVFLQPTSGKRV